MFERRYRQCGLGTRGVELGVKAWTVPRIIQMADPRERVPKRTRRSNGLYRIRLSRVSFAPSRNCSTPPSSRFALFRANSLERVPRWTGERTLSANCVGLAQSQKGGLVGLGATHKSPPLISCSATSETWPGSGRGAAEAGGMKHEPECLEMMRWKERRRVEQARGRISRANQAPEASTLFRARRLIGWLLRPSPSRLSGALFQQPAHTSVHNTTMSPA